MTRVAGNNFIAGLPQMGNRNKGKNALDWGTDWSPVTGRGGGLNSYSTPLCEFNNGKVVALKEEKLISASRLIGLGGRGGVQRGSPLKFVTLTFVLKLYEGVTNLGGEHYSG